MDAAKALADGSATIVAGDFNIQAPRCVLHVGTNPAQTGIFASS
ncbi:MAG: hypothetical protein VBE63_05360 [Lamprobacter sp.]|nr:hypothetical protein [Lamprobacter sp.]MEA3639355.1 hypothetical protein [Lamprobacter sp.]